jgi:putative ABC transport system permease protein
VTYIETDDRADVSAIEAKITELYMKYRSDDFTSSNTQAKAYLQPLLDIHLNKEIQGPAAVTGDRKTVYFFTIIGLITLIIALVNYVNLATARAMDRSKEVGVRKVVGAQKTQLVGQFLMESGVTNIVALILAITLSLLLLPVVNRVAEVEMSRDLWLDGRFWAVFLGIFAAGALLSGVYPAFMLSSFKPVTVLKGKVGAFTSKMPLRKVLVVIQFAASIALLAGTVIVYTQLSYMQRLDTGLDLEQILVVEGPTVRAENADRGSEMTTLKSELRQIPSVQEAALSATTPGRGFLWYTMMYRETADPSTSRQIRATRIDDDFDEVFGLKLAAGQAFPQGFAEPDSGATPVMVNETMARELGFSTNEEAIDQRITTGGGGDSIIRGVFEDFRWSSAHREAEAVMFQYDDGGGHISMKVTTAELPQAISAVEDTYKRLFPDNPFNYYFADAAFDEQYKADRRFATLFGAFAGIAIIIACLGLFGLASFTAEQRTKEIGVRKVLGATVGSVVGLLSKEFVILVGVAFLIATPAAYFYMKDWLDDFAYHITLGPGVFVLAGVIGLFTALVAVSYQAINAALADPVKSLRYE